MLCDLLPREQSGLLLFMGYLLVQVPWDSEVESDIFKPCAHTVVSFFPEHVMFPGVLSEKAPWFSPGLLAKQKFKVAPAASGLPAVGS